MVAVSCARRENSEGLGGIAVDAAKYGGDAEGPTIIGMGGIAMRFRDRILAACYAYGLCLFAITATAGQWWWPLIVIPVWELTLWIWKRDLDSRV